MGSGRISTSLCQASEDAERAFETANHREGVWQRSDPKAPLPLGLPACQNRPPEWNEHITSRMWRKNKAKSAQSTVTDEAFLRSLFQQEIRKTKPRQRRIFLDVFSGCGRIASQLRRRGLACIAIDNCLDPRLDVLKPKILNVIRGWIKGGCVQAIWLATPCSSWSRARHGPFGSAWGPLRDNQNIYGFKGLSSRDQTKIKDGNATIMATCEILRLAVRLKIPCFLENPAGSMLWLAPPLARLCRLSCSRPYICDFCQYGARWRKRTRIQGWFSQPDLKLSCTCTGKQGICSRTGVHHIILKGQDPKSKQLWTHLAQPYPHRFAFCGAEALVRSAESIHDFHLRARFGN